MEFSREILLNSLETSGVRLPNDVSSFRDLTPTNLVSICGQSLNLIAQTTSSPTSLADSSVADQFKVCSDMASSIKGLGYLGELSFHNFLYPSEDDSCKLVRFLVERLSESSSGGGRWAGLKGGDETSNVKEGSCGRDLGKCESGDERLDLSGYDKLGPKWDEFALKGQEPELLNFKGEDGSVSSEANILSERLDETSIDNVSCKPGDADSSKEKQFEVEITAESSELKHLEEELKLLKEAVDIALDVDHPVEFYLEKLKKEVDARRHHLGELKSQQKVVRRPLEEKKKCIEESRYANDPDAQEKLQKLKDLELEKESILSGIRQRGQELSKLSIDLEKQPKVASRRSYIERVIEITKNSRKQDADIEQILKNTRELQLESNSIQDRLHRTYAVVDELVFREAKKDTVGRQAYRLLTSIHETFEQMREKILATDRIRREATEHEKKLTAMASRNLNAEKLEADLEVIRRENAYLEKSLHSSRIDK